MSNHASRLLTLILILQRQPGKKAAELAKELDVSVRTLHRYLSDLDEMGIPICSERGPYGGFSLVRGYKMPPLIFSQQEAAAVFLGTSLVGTLWGKLYQEAAQSALIKLDNLLPDEQRREVDWARQALVVSGLHRFDFHSQMASLETLRGAIRSQQRLEISYHGSGKMAPNLRRVDPYALVYRWGWWYVVGYCHLRSALRTFRVDRILEIALVNESFTIPPEFNVQAYLDSEPQPQPQIEARILFSAEAYSLAHSLNFVGLKVEDQADGSVLATFSAFDLEFATQMVMSFGPLVRVISPPSLQQRVVEYAQAICSIYTTGTIK